MTPGGQEVHEVWVQFEPGRVMLNELTTALADSKVDILSMHAQVAGDGLTDVVAYVEMAGSTVPAEDLIRSIKERCGACEARIERKGRMRFEGFLFPVLVDGEERGVILEEGAWAAVVRRLESTYGSGGCAILYEQGLALGEAFASSIVKKLGKASASARLENFAAMFRSAGLGVLEFDESPAGFRVTVRRPIAAATSARTGDRFLPGMIEGALGLICASDFTATNIKFQDNVLTFDVVSHVVALPSAQHLSSSRSGR